MTNTSRLFYRGKHLFSSSTTNAKPPIANDTLAGRYASALYSASSKLQTLDKTYQEATNLHNLLSSDHTLNLFFRNPTINSTAKKDHLNSTIFKTAAQPVTPAFRNFIMLLVENGRLDMFWSIYGVYEEMMKVKNNEIDVVVTSAIGLDATLLGRIEQLVKKKFIGDGYKVTFRSRVDESLMGGFIVEIGNKTIDLSVAQQVAAIEREVAFI